MAPLDGMLLVANLVGPCPYGHLEFAGRKEIAHGRRVIFDPETLAMLREVLDDTWSCLPAGQTNVTRSQLAERILKAAKAGERDPAKLRARAIAEVIEVGL